MSYNDDNSHLHRPLFDAVAFASPRVNKQKLKQVKQLRLNSDYPTVPEVKVTKKQLHIQDMDKRKLTLQKELETTKDQRLRYQLLDQFHKNSNAIDTYWNDYTSQFDDILGDKPSHNTKRKK